MFEGPASFHLGTGVLRHSDGGVGSSVHPYVRTCVHVYVHGHLQ